MKIKKTAIRNLEIVLLIAYLVFVISNFKDALLPMPFAISMVLLTECILDATGHLSYVEIAKKHEANSWMKNELVEEENEKPKEEKNGEEAIQEVIAE
jgi:hypothetical protein